MCADGAEEREGERRRKKKKTLKSEQVYASVCF